MKTISACVTNRTTGGCIPPSATRTKPCWLVHMLLDPMSLLKKLSLLWPWKCILILLFKLHLVNYYLDNNMAVIRTAAGRPRISIHYLMSVIATT